MKAVYRKEMRQYFHSVIGYVFLAIFVFINCILLFAAKSSDPQRRYYGLFPGHHNAGDVPDAYADHAELF